MIDKIEVESISGWKNLTPEQHETVRQWIAQFGPSFNGNALTHLETMIGRMVKENANGKTSPTVPARDESRSVAEEIETVTVQRPHREVGRDYLQRVLSKTIKGDDTNKEIAFLAMLSAFTDDNQMNISFNGRSSTGKSYLPLELMSLFPKEDVLDFGKVSPMAFFHDESKYDATKQAHIVDFERKVLIFTDMPHPQLLEHLRSLLSHDKKVIVAKITDKTDKGGMKAKNIHLIGYPSVIFCSANMKMDEQEATRFILLSPETSQQKILDSIDLKLKRAGDEEAFNKSLDADPEREDLKRRILAIRNEKIGTVKLGSEPLLRNGFMKLFDGNLPPRAMRDIGTVIRLAKSFAVLNCWYRRDAGGSIVSNTEDAVMALSLYKEISKSQELGLAPAVVQIFEEAIVPACLKAKTNGKAGASRADVMQEYSNVAGGKLPDYLLKRQIIPALMGAGLIDEEPDPDDKRRKLIIVLEQKVSNGGTGLQGLAQELEAVSATQTTNSRPKAA